MPPEKKTIPIATPKLPRRIVEGFRAAIADPKKRPQAYIRLRASGGVHGEAYDFEYRIDAEGRTAAHLIDELKSRRHGEPKSPVKLTDSKHFASLARSLDIEALIRSDAPSSGFPPDSVVGRLEVSDGEQTATWLFLADDKQAVRAQLMAPEPLQRAVDAVYRAAAAHLGVEDLRP